MKCINPDNVPNVRFEIILGFAQCTGSENLAKKNPKLRLLLKFSDTIPESYLANLDVTRGRGQSGKKNFLNALLKGIVSRDYRDLQMI